MERRLVIFFCLSLSRAQGKERRRAADIMFFRAPVVPQVGASWRRFRRLSDIRRLLQRFSGETRQIAGWMRGNDRVASQIRNSPQEDVLKWSTYKWNYVETI